jgi:hypothetical protein
MRTKSPVLALSAILASFLLIAAQHPAGAACADGSSSGCDESGQGIGKLAEAGVRSGPEDLRARERDIPSDLWDRVRTLPLPPAALEDLTKRMEDIVHKISEAQAHAAEAEKKVRDTDDAIDRLKSDRITAEGDKHAAEDERDRQQARLFALMQDSLRDFRPPPPVRPVEDWRERRWYFRPRPVFHHYCPPFLPPWREHEYRPPREHGFYPPPREDGVREFQPPCCGCWRDRRE